MIGLTYKQRRVIEFIRLFTQQNGWTPSFKEIAAGVGMKSTGAVHRIIHILVERGRLAILPGQARSIEVLHAPDDLTIHLPADLLRVVQELAERAGVTPESIVIEAVRDQTFSRRSQIVSCETSKGRAAA